MDRIMTLPIVATFECPRCANKTLNCRDNKSTKGGWHKYYFYCTSCGLMNETATNMQGPNQLFPAYHEFCEEYKNDVAVESVSAASGGGATPFPPHPPIEETETINYVASAAGGGGGVQEEDSDKCGNLAAFKDNLVIEVPEYATESGYENHNYLFAVCLSAHASLFKKSTDLYEYSLAVQLSAPKFGYLGWPLLPQSVEAYCNDPIGSVASMHEITKFLRKEEEIEYDEYKNTIFDFADLLYPHDPPIEGSIFDWLTKNVFHKDFNTLFHNFITSFIDPTNWNVHKLFNDSYMNYAYNLNDFETKVILKFSKEFTTPDAFLEFCKEELLNLHLQFIRYNFFEYAGPIVKKSRHRTRTGSLINQRFYFAEFIENGTSRGISVIIYKDTPLFELLNYWFITQNIGTEDKFAKFYKIIKTREGSKIYPEFVYMYNFLVWMFTTYGEVESKLMLDNFTKLITKTTIEYTMTTNNIIDFIGHIRICTINWIESSTLKTDNSKILEILKTNPVKWFNFSCFLDNREKRMDPSKVNNSDSLIDTVQNTQNSQPSISNENPDEYNLKTRVGDFGYDSLDPNNQPIIVKMQQAINIFLEMNEEIDKQYFEDPFYVKFACNEPLAHILKTIAENSIGTQKEGGGGARGGKRKTRRKRSRATKRRKTRKHK